MWPLYSIFHREIVHCWVELYLNKITSVPGIASVSGISNVGGIGCVTVVTVGTVQRIEAVLRAAKGELRLVLAYIDKHKNEFAVFSFSLLFD